MSENAAAIEAEGRPETYNVTITVSLPDGSAELKVKMPGILRADIMAPNYPAQGIAQCVRNFEFFVFGEEPQ